MAHTTRLPIFWQSGGVRLVFAISKGYFHLQLDLERKQSGKIALCGAYSVKGPLREQFTKY